MDELEERKPLGYAVLLWGFAIVLYIVGLVTYFINVNYYIKGIFLFTFLGVIIALISVISTVKKALKFRTDNSWLFVFFSVTGFII